MRKLAVAPILFASTLSLFLSSPICAGSVDDAERAYNRGDYKTAYRLFRKMADKGNAKAQGSLGVMYENGQGVPQDYAEAVKWYREAAEQGDPVAQNNLGNMYRHGRGVRGNYDEAAKWYRRGAEQGLESAQLNFGYLHVAGKGVPRDYVQAYKWFDLAVAGYSASSRKEQEDWARKNRDLAASKMTSAQIAEAQRLAREWKPRMER